MKTLPEIFKDNPQLLETEEVKELVEQFRIQYMDLRKSKSDFWMKITDLTMHSDFFLIDGLDCKKVVEQIHDLAFGN